MRLLLLVLLASPLAAAQTSETYIQQAGVTFGASVEDVALAGAVAGEALARTLMEAPLSSNVVSITQEGDENRAVLAQNGLGNQLSLVVNGSRNVVEVAQRGNDNLLVGDIIGDGNRLTDSFQIGDGNSYTLTLEGTGTEHTLRQEGDGNQAVQVVGAGMTPASIEQYGGATVTVVRR